MHFTLGNLKFLMQAYQEGVMLNVCLQNPKTKFYDYSFSVCLETLDIRTSTKETKKWHEVKVIILDKIEEIKSKLKEIFPEG